MGNILTWLVRDLDSSGNFFMKAYAEQAYSRIRGVQCEIVPKAGSGPRFWINELKRHDESLPHVERESGMHGYDGELDFSDFDNLKEYALRGISPSSGNMIFRSSPIPVKIELDRENKTTK